MSNKQIPAPSIIKTDFQQIRDQHLNSSHSGRRIWYMREWRYVTCVLSLSLSSTSTPSFSPSPSQSSRNVKCRLPAECNSCKTAALRVLQWDKPYHSLPVFVRQPPSVPITDVSSRWARSHRSRACSHRYSSSFYFQDYQIDHQIKPCVFDVAWSCCRDQTKPRLFKSRSQDNLQLSHHLSLFSLVISASIKNTTEGCRGLWESVVAYLQRGEQLQRKSMSLLICCEYICSREGVRSISECFHSCRISSLTPNANKINPRKCQQHFSSKEVEQWARG